MTGTSAGESKEAGPGRAVTNPQVDMAAILARLSALEAARGGNVLPRVADDDEVTSESGGTAGILARLAALEAESLASSQPFTPAPQRAARSLTFTSASVPVHGGRRDYYLGSLARATVHQSSPATTAPPAGIAVTGGLRLDVPTPRIFDGSGAAADLPRQLADFFRHVERFLHYSYAARGQQATADQFLADACLYLGGPALQVVEELEFMSDQHELQSGQREEVTWTKVKAALEARFGRPLSSYQVIGELLELKQGAGELVRVYSQRFDVLHIELLRLGLDYRDLSARLFVRGLRDDIRGRVNEVITSQRDWFDRESIGVREASKAVAAIRQLALAKEEVIAAIRAQRSAPGAQAASANTASNEAGSKGSKPKKKKKARAGSAASSEVPASDKRIDIPPELYRARRAAGVCFRCNSAKHSIQECASKLNYLPAPPPRRANTMNAASASDSESDESESGEE